MCFFRVSWQAQDFVDLEVQISWQVQDFVSLGVQISWQAQDFVDLEVQMSWQVEYFAGLEVQISRHLRYFVGPECVAGAGLCLGFVFRGGRSTLWTLKCRLWQAQYFVDVEVQISWQAQDFGLGVQISWLFVAGANS